jgi:hypothetical protein
MREIPEKFREKQGSREIGQQWNGKGETKLLKPLWRDMSLERSF